jgi:hypothetical protein
MTIPGSLTTTPALVPFAGSFQGLLAESGDAGGGNALFSLAFTEGTWTAPTALGGSADTIASPAIAAVGSSLQAVYLNPAHEYFQASFVTTWDTGSTPVEPEDAGNQAFGPAGASATATPTQLVIAYGGNNTLPYAQTWTPGTGWDNGVQLGSGAVEAGTTLAITTLDSGALLVVYAAASGSCNNPTGCLYSALGTAVTPRTWSAPALVDPNAFTPYSPTIVAMSGGRALVAWEGANGEGYYSVYTTAPSTGWSTPAQLTSALIANAPSLAPGVCGDDAVAAYVSSGQVYTTHFAGGAWTTPGLQAAVSGSTFVTIATAP